MVYTTTTKTIDMTPKEKANELYYEYFDIIDKSNPLEDIKNTAKQCALICVDETIKEHLYISQNYDWQNESYQELEDIKQEIEKLFIPDVVKPFFCLKKPTVIGPQKCDKQCSYCKMEESLQ